MPETGFRSRQQSPGQETRRGHQGWAGEGREGQDRRELLDPWGNEYFVRLDSDHDEELADPFGGKKIFARIVIVWSAGPDGKTNRDPAHKDNDDNVYSWK